MAESRNPTGLFVVLGGLGCAVLLAAVLWPSDPGPTHNDPGPARPSTPGRHAERVAPEVVPDRELRSPLVNTQREPRRIIMTPERRAALEALAGQKLPPGPANVPGQPATAPGGEDGVPSSGIPPDPTPGDKRDLTGTVTAEQIRSAVKEVLPAVQHCYESGLKMKADSHGTVKTAFTLVVADGGGFMRDAEVQDSDLGNPLVDSCVLEALSNAHFPMPEGGGEVRVHYPFRFESADPNAPARR